MFYRSVTFSGLSTLPPPRTRPLFVMSYYYHTYAVHRYCCSSPTKSWFFTTGCCRFECTGETIDGSLRNEWSEFVVFFNHVKINSDWTLWIWFTLLFIYYKIRHFSVNVFFFFFLKTRCWYDHIFFFISVYRRTPYTPCTRERPWFVSVDGGRFHLKKRSFFLLLSVSFKRV